jgi:hypothetical protein
MLLRSSGGGALNLKGEGLPGKKRPSRFNVDVSYANSVDTYDEIPNFKASKI